jgi:hypothetical protein
MARTMGPGARDGIPGERTRQKLIEAGVIFGRQLEATTTRMLADRAGDPSLPSHFPQKQGGALPRSGSPHCRSRTPAYRSAVAEINEALASELSRGFSCYPGFEHHVSTILATEAKSWAITRADGADKRF